LVTGFFTAAFFAGLLPVEWLGFAIVFFTDAFFAGLALPAGRAGFLVAAFPPFGWAGFLVGILFPFF
jgi:hypothetical protein